MTTERSAATVDSRREFAQNVADAAWEIEKVAVKDGDFEDAFHEVKALAHALRRAVEIGEKL